MDIDDIILNYNPANPHRRFRTVGLPAEPEGAALPPALPWAGVAAPKPTDDLTRFAGYDAVMVTWTSAPASALASLLSPGFGIAEWYECRYNVRPPPV